MKLMNKTNFVIILIILAAGFLIQKFWLGSDIKAYEFTGSIQKIDGQTIYMHGNYNSPDHPEWRSASQAVNVKVKVGSDTKLVRIAIYRSPDFAAQVAAGKTVDPETLRQEITTGSLSDFAGGNVNGATIETSSNIYGDKNFLAQSITYYYVFDEE